MAIGVSVVLSMALFAGCTPAQPVASATPTHTPVVTSPSAAPTSPAAPTALQPDGSADDNLSYFRAVVETVSNSAESVSGRAYIDALAAAGFDKSVMQVTNDTTTIGDAAESIQFSVRWDDGECLIGQVGPATGAPVTAVLPVVGDGVCLLGKTRPIDW